MGAWEWGGAGCGAGETAGAGRARTSSDLGRSCCSSERGRGRRLPDTSPAVKMSGAELRCWRSGPTSALGVVAVGPTSTSSLSRSFCSYDVVSMPSEPASSSRPPARPQRLAEVAGVRAAGVEALTRAATGDVDRTAMLPRAGVLEEEGSALERAAAAGETTAGLCSGPLLTMLSSWKIRCCCICTVVSSREMRSSAARSASSMRSLCVAWRAAAAARARSKQRNRATQHSSVPRQNALGVAGRFPTTTAWAPVSQIR